MPSFDDQDPPCETCDFAVVCGSARLACRQFVAYFNSDARYAERERRPNRLDYLLVHMDLNVHELRDRIGEIRRETRAQGRDPTYSELSAALGIDADAVAELVVRYARKQGMRVKSVAIDDRSQRGVEDIEDSSVNA